jgi:hypothetical protein
VCGANNTRFGKFENHVCGHTGEACSENRNRKEIQYMARKRREKKKKDTRSQKNEMIPEK